VRHRPICFRGAALGDEDQQLLALIADEQLEQFQDFFHRWDKIGHLIIEKLC